jgi:uncharacterized protein (DUF3820 family)
MGLAKRLHWFAREGFPNGEPGRLLALMQEMDHNGLRLLLDPLRKSNKPGIYKHENKNK